jgi:hypothetical protein
MGDKADLVEEPTTEQETAKPMRRAHCKTRPRLEERTGERSDASGDTETSELASAGEVKAAHSGAGARKAAQDDGVVKRCQKRKPRSGHSEAAGSHSKAAKRIRT